MAVCDSAKGPRLAKREGLTRILPLRVRGTKADRCMHLPIGSASLHWLSSVPLARFGQPIASSSSVTDSLLLFNDAICYHISTSIVILSTLALSTQL